MAVSFTCRCGKRLRGGNEWAGKKVKCPGCGQILLVPAPKDSKSPACAVPTPPAPPPAPAPASGRVSRRLVLAGAGGAVLAFGAGAVLLGWFLASGSPQLPTPTAPVQTQAPATQPEEKPPAVAREPAQTPDQPTREQPAQTASPDKAEKVQVPYATAGLATARLEATEAKLKALGYPVTAEKADLEVSERITVQAVPVGLLREWYKAGVTVLKAMGNFKEAKSDLPADTRAFVDWWLVPQSIMLAPNDKERPRLRLIREDALVGKKLRKELGLGAFLVPSAERYPGMRKLVPVEVPPPDQMFGLGLPLSLPRWLARFDPEGQVRDGDAPAVAEELVWSKEMGLGDGTRQSLPTSRRVLQAALLEALGFEVGNPADVNPAKRATAEKKLVDARKTLLDTWNTATEGEAKPTPPAAGEQPATAPAKGSADVTCGTPVVLAWPIPFNPLDPAWNQLSKEAAAEGAKVMALQLKLEAGKAILLLRIKLTTPKPRLLLGSPTDQELETPRAWFDHFRLVLDDGKTIAAAGLSGAGILLKAPTDRGPLVKLSGSGAVEWPVDVVFVVPVDVREARLQFREQERGKVPLPQHANRPRNQPQGQPMRAAPAPAASFRGLGPNGKPLSVAVYTREWLEGNQARGVLRVNKDDQPLIFRVTPEGYPGVVAAGGPAKAARYTLKTTDGTTYAGAAVGFVGNDDVVEFSIPKGTRLPSAGVIEVGVPKHPLSSPPGEEKAVPPGDARKRMPLDQCASLLNATDPDVRIVALENAFQHKDQERLAVVDLIVKGVGDQNAGVRSTAAGLAAQLKDPRTVTPLIDALKSKEPVENYTGAFRLHSGWQASCIRALIASDDRAFRASGKAKGAVAIVRDYLREDQPDDAVQAAAEFLGRMKDATSVSRLGAIVGGKGSRHNRASAATALGAIGGSEAQQTLVSRALGTDEFEPRQASIEALGNFKTQEVHAALLKLLRNRSTGNPTDAWLVGTAAKAAVRAEVPGVLAELERLAQENRMGRGGRDLCVMVVAALRSYQGSDKEVVRVFRHLAAHENSNVPTAAIEAAESRGSEGIHFLIDSLRHDNPTVRVAAANALGRVAARDALPALEQAVKDSNEFVRGAAAAAIQAIHDRKELEMFKVEKTEIVPEAVEVRGCRVEPKQGHVLFVCKVKFTKAGLSLPYEEFIKLEVSKTSKEFSKIYGTLIAQGDFRLRLKDGALIPCSCLPQSGEQPGPKVLIKAAEGEDGWLMYVGAVQILAAVKPEAKPEALIWGGKYEVAVSPK